MGHCKNAVTDDGWKQKETESGISQKEKLQTAESEVTKSGRIKSVGNKVGGYKIEG